jgi:hypothetical protein
MEMTRKYRIDLFFKLPVSRFLAINIEGKIYKQSEMIYLERVDS